VSKVNWVEYLPVPEGVRLRTIEPDGRHPLTPDGVRHKYAYSVHDGSLVAWADEEAGVAGARAGIGEIAWRQEPGGRLEFEFARPGKGNGYFTIVYRGAESSQAVAIASAEGFEEDRLDWFRGLLSTLAQASGARPRIIDVGADA
jgi:hypothetical protein